MCTVHIITILSRLKMRIPARRFCFRLSLPQNDVAPARHSLYAWSMINPFLHTKCHLPPTRPNGVPRTRLGERLQGGLLAGRKLALISAPAGYGKSTLAAGWVRQTGLPFAWLSLDEQDNDFGRFLAYLLLALQKIAANAGVQTRLALDAPQLPSAETIAACLCHDLVQLGEVNGRFLLALDDYHKIRLPLIHDLLNRLLDHLPPTCHLLLISREDPPLPLPRLRVRGEMTEVRARDLRFTAAETEQFFNQAMQLGLPPEWVEALAARTEGWIASLQLAALSLQGRDAAQTEVFIREFGGSHRYVFDYLAEEVLGQQSEEIQAFLRATAVLDRFNASLCQALTGRADSQDILHQLEQANLFLVSLDDERNWHRYHHLFADYLQADLTPSDLAALYQKAALWHEYHAMPFEAVRYALSSDDTEFAADIIERALAQDTTWSGGNVALLSSWLDALPPHIWSERPQLSLHASRILYLSGHFDLAEKYIAQTEESLKRRPVTAAVAHMIALASLYRGAIAAVKGDVAQAIAQITHAQQGLAAEDHLAHARAFFSLGLAHELAGDPAQAIQNYEQSSKTAQTAGVLFLTVHGRCAAAQVHIGQGRLNLAEAACRQAIQAAKHQPDIAPLGLAEIILGGIALERNKLDAAAEHLTKGMALARKGGLMDDVILGLAYLARLRVAQKEGDAAMAALQEASQIIQTFGIQRMSELIAAYVARLHLHNGQMAAAVQWAAAVQQAAPNQSGAADTLHEFVALTLARVLLAQGDLATAQAIVATVQQQAAVAGRQRTQLEALVVEALVQAAEGAQETAVVTLSNALQLAAPEQICRLFLDEGIALAGLLPQARAAAPPFVDDLLDAMAAELGETAVTAVNPNALSEQERNVLRLVSAGLSNREIAAELVISPGTAKWHVHNILQKLDVSSRTQAAARAHELGLVD